MKKIVPSIMCANPLRLEKELDLLSSAGIDWLHIDVMDGIFVDNLAMAPYTVSPIIKSGKFTVDIHLACIDPEKYVEMFSSSNKNIDYITFHIEATDDPERVIDLIHAKGIKVGIAISPNTRIESVFPYLEKVELILMMTVEPGFAGQKFQPHVLGKIEKLNDKLNSIEKKPLVEVDGNINDETIKKIERAGGADLYVVGTSSLFYESSLSYKKRIQLLEESVGI